MRTSWSSAIARAHLFLALAACSRGAQVGEAGDASVLPDTSEAARDAAAGDADSDARAAPCIFAECVRRQDWREADIAYGTLPDEARRLPAVAIARARVLVGLSRVNEALAVLSDVEPKATGFAETILAVRIAAVRKDAAAVRAVPEVAKAVAGTLSRSGDSRARLESVPLLDDVAAAVVLDRLISGKNVPKDVAIAARRIRSLRAGHASDVRWLFINAPKGDDVAPSDPLSLAEWMKRGDGLARQGNTDAALAANARADELATSDKEKQSVARHRAYLLYKSRNRYVEAAELLGKLGKSNDVHAAEDAFHAARALSRADRDDDAIAGYEALARAKPKSEWGMRASYFVGYLRALHGEWSQAEAALLKFVGMRSRITETQDAKRFLAIAAFAQGKWSVARSRFLSLAKETKAPDEAKRAEYLASLADVRGGNQNGQEAWQSIATRDPFSYAGVMARARLRKAGKVLGPPRPVSPKDGDAILSPTVAALHATGLDDDAEAILESQLARVSVREACASYQATDRAHFQFMRAGSVPEAAIEGGQWWAWSCVYPSPYKVWVSPEAKVPPSLVWAVMRQESGFNPRATSPALAKGLLQLVDDTARTMERELGLAVGDLYDARHNIALGTKYIGNLLDRFRGQAPLAVGAYNAGPEAIARWLGRVKLEDPEVFVEFIPYHETRNYVARVMGNYARYLWLTEARELSLPTELLQTDR